MTRSPTTGNRGQQALMPVTDRAVLVPITQPDRHNVGRPARDVLWPFDPTGGTD